MSHFSGQQKAAEPVGEPSPRERSAWRCAKCSHHEAEISQSRQSGSLLASVFDVEGLRFTTVSCRRCGYTEFYKADSSLLGKLFDFGVG